MKKPILVVYATALERKYLKYSPKAEIGLGGIKIGTLNLSKYRSVILFGCCGALKKIPLNQFIFDIFPFSKYYCASHPVHDKVEADEIRQWFPGALAVEMESDWLRDECEKHNIPLLMIIKFPIDFCEKKAMPVGINHFWRKYQLWRMQKKFDRFMKRYSTKSP